MANEMVYIDIQKQNQKRMSQADYLASILPLNSVGLPTGYWRLDLLPLENMTEAHLEIAWVPLSYSNGYPALPDGNTFWSQLPFEGAHDYEEFQKYLKMGTYRVLPYLVNGTTLGELQVMSSCYYWTWRAKAYDMCREVERESRRQQLIYDLELDHLSKASRYAKLADDLISSDSFRESASPKDAIALAKLAFQMGRVAAGLPGWSPAREEEGTSINVEQLTVLHREDKTQIFVERVLQSADLTATAQDLAIKLMQEGFRKENSPQKPQPHQTSQSSEVIDVPAE